MKTQTDISPNWDYKNDPQFSKAMLVYWISGFLLGCLIGAFLILGIMSLID